MKIFLFPQIGESTGMLKFIVTELSRISIPDYPVDKLR